MNPASGGAEVHLSVVALRRIDEITARFEDAWSADDPPRIEDFLPLIEESERAALFRELLLSEIELRREGDSPLDEAAYLARFPHFLDIVRTILVLHPERPPQQDVPATRVAAGARPSPAGQKRACPAGYSLVRELGRGGMGIVSLARQIRLDRFVALKVLLARYQTDIDLRARFQTEAAAVARLQHPNIVQIHEIGEDQGLLWLTLEYCDRGSLAEWLFAKPVGAREAAQLVQTLAGAVQAAHSAGVIHRDLKPANVLLTSGRANARPVPASDAGDTELASAIPKITDFGLAKRLDEPSLTVSGVVVGTPSYMPPEQTVGSKDIGPAADIYSLGAILYECLTGRPPFRAATTLDTLMQVRTEEPVPPRRLNSRVPRDLETIVLTCLNKDPLRRYPSAAALADDLGRWLAGQPILARPVGPLERAGKWARQRPAVAGLLAALLVAILVGFGGMLWYVNDRAERTTARTLRGAQTQREVAAALDEAERVCDEVRQLLRDPRRIATLTNDSAVWQGRLQVARSAVRRADSLAENSESPLDPELLARLGAVDARLKRDEQDHELAGQLERIRQATVFRIEDGRLDLLAAGPKYTETFRQAGWHFDRDSPSELIARVRDSSIRLPLVIALDEWAGLTADRSLRARLLEVARAADPGYWSDQLRDPKTWEETEALQRLARQAIEARATAPLLTWLAGLLQRAGSDPIPLLHEAALQHAGDFWLNLALGTHGHDALRREAFCRAALGVRPSSGLAFNNLGSALLAQGRLADALPCFQWASQVDPSSATAFVNQGYCQWKQGRRAEALASYREAIRLAPKEATAHRNIGIVLSEQGHRDEAIDWLRKAVALAPADASAHDSLCVNLLAKGALEQAVTSGKEAVRLAPDNASYRYNLGNAYFKQGKFALASDAFRAAIQIDPKKAGAHYNLGNALVELGELAQASDSYRSAIRHDPKHVNAHANLGLTLSALKQYDKAIEAYQQALKLDPAHANANYLMGNQQLRLGQFDAAIGHYRKTIATEPGHSRARTNLGNALWQQEKRKEALAQYRAAVESDPKNAVAQFSLGMALLEQGELEKAIASLQAALKLVPNFAQAKALLADARRSADLLDKLESLRKGNHEPESNGERLSLARLAFRRNLPLLAARLYKEAFAQDEKAADVRTGQRFLAASAAALAGTGRGESQLEEKERFGWRNQAREWLAADLTSWREGFEKSPAVAASASRALARWRATPDLAGVRDEKALSGLPADEQKAWGGLWQDVMKLHEQTQSAVSSREE